MEWEHGPHNHEYIAAKEKVLRACIRERRATPYAAAEAGFDYRPPADHDKGPLADGESGRGRAGDFVNFVMPDFQNSERILPIEGVTNMALLSNIEFNNLVAVVQYRRNKPQR